MHVYVEFVILGCHAAMLLSYTKRNYKINHNQKATSFDRELELETLV